MNLIKPAIASKLYDARFNEIERIRKERVWRVLCQYFFQKYVNPTDTVLDLGAGYCEFINNIVCGTRIAVDINPESQQYAAPDVRFYNLAGTDLNAIDSNYIDVVFASNFFEHLQNKALLLQSLIEIRRVLRSGGRLMVMQPNIRAIGAKYWDFFDHYLPLSDRALIEALNIIEIEVIEVKARFLPYHTKYRFPFHPILVRLYLKLPFLHRCFGGQAWIVGVKP